MFDVYEKFIADIDTELCSYFEEQSPFVFCKKGCSLCCSLGEYPMSQLEFEYLRYGFAMLDDKYKKIVLNRIKKLKKEYEKQISTKSSKPFEHACPFLIGSECCVYQYRALICRTFGLIKSVNTKDGYVAILPDCIHQGLNYSNVYDSKNNTISAEKIASVGKGCEPKLFDVSVPSLYKRYPDQTVDFSDIKNMVDYLVSGLL